MSRKGYLGHRAYNLDCPLSISLLIPLVIYSAPHAYPQECEPHEGRKFCPFAHCSIPGPCTVCYILDIQYIFVDKQMSE